MPTDIQWSYGFRLPMSDMRSDPTAATPGFCPRVSGVDGRITGGLRRFPGFRGLRQIGTSITVQYGFTTGFDVSCQKTPTLDFFKYVEMKMEANYGLLRGFVVQKGPEVGFEYYDTATSSWTYFKLITYSSGDVDVTSGGTRIFVSDDDQRGVSAFWANDQLSVFPLGHEGLPSNPVVGSTSVEFYSAAVTTQGLLVWITDGSPRYITYGYRLGDSKRGVWSPLQYKMVDRTVASGTTQYGRIGAGNAAPDFNQLTISLSAEEAVNYDTVEVYRTILNGGAFLREIYWCAPYALGIDGATLANLQSNVALSKLFTTPGILGVSGGQIGLVLAIHDTVLATVTNTNGLPVLVGQMSDAALTYQPEFDIEEDAVGNIPYVQRVYCLDGVLFAQTASLYPSQGARNIIWSKTTEWEPENFLESNYYAPSCVSDVFTNIIRCGDVLFGVSPNRLFRISLLGSGVSVERAPFSGGSVGRWGATDAGAFMAILGPSSLSLVDPGNGSSQTVGVVERILTSDSEWKTSLSGVFLTYDASSGCLFLVNPTKAEALCLWNTTNVATRLDDTNFVAGTVGPHPETGGTDRAFFITTNGWVVYPDAQRENTVQTMLGVTGTVNGTFTSASSGTTLTDSTAAFATSLQDCYVHILSGVSIGERRLISSNTGTALTVTAAVTVAIGDRYSISPIPFEIQGWMLVSGKEITDPTFQADLFTRRISVGMGYNVDLLEGDTAGTNAFITLQMLKNNSTTPLVTQEVALQEYPHKNWGHLPAAGPMLFPGIKCLASDLDFILRGVIIQGSIEDDIQDD